MAFFSRQLASELASPLLIAFLAVACAVACRALNYRRMTRWLSAVAVAVAYLGSTQLVGNALLRPLERAYPPLAEDRSYGDIRDVVVLGSGFSPRDRIPVTAALDREGLVRITEAIRISRRIHEARLILLGGAPPGQVPAARGYAMLALDLGVASSTLIVLNKSLNTKEEADSVVALLGKTPFILVTSASHMPRAMSLMQAAGARAIPAPTGQLTTVEPEFRWRDLLPTSGGLRKSELALHEYLGMGALKIGLE